MSKKKKKKAQQLRQAEETAQSLTEFEKEGITPRGKKTIGGGIAVLIAGFIVLSFTDPEGRNWASTLAPILILGAYGIIAVGIFLPEPEPVAENTTKEDPPIT